MKPTLAHTSLNGDEFTILVFYSPSTLLEQFHRWMYEQPYLDVKVCKGKMWDWNANIGTTFLNEIAAEFMVTGEAVQHLPIRKGDEVFL